MLIGFKIVICLAAVKFILAQDDDGFTNENRPYEFGFNIEGYQHRHEKKDEKGIIMGEFGFITADGVYHLTVYATDEQGRFKILKMKNTYIGLPMDKIMTPVPAVASVTTPKPIQVTSTHRKLTKLNGKAACGGCLVPLDVKPEKDTPETFPPISAGKTYPNNNAAFEGNVKIPNNRLLQNNIYAQQNQNSQPPLGPSINSLNNQKAYVQPNINLQAPKSDSQFNNENLSKNNEPLLKTNNFKQGKSLNTFNEPNFDSIKPIQNNQNQNYEYKKMNISDLMGILYKFNYTLSYHGHNEIGNRAGEKNGSYFFNGRDGFGRNVKYIANEFGYQPNITLVDLSVDQTPKEETEKVLTKLLGNEFIWYY
ncbi:hypothetical protein O3M35_011062 [Rhynocoris fuscipes]|uniref:Protein lethal(3)malignant blood neoplasm 1 n=1 Tax=Rhynocoris fuscipes TaxID=488301 RepID=A0AAW1CV77_9HEMI